MRPFLALYLVFATPALAQIDQYIDDRSSPERVVISLYNAIDRHEYLRGWSYFDPDTAPPLDQFIVGYAETETVALRIGNVQVEGAAGSIHASVPVALKATATDGTETVFIGCYRLTQVQPGAQELPPFRPIQIDEGKLEKTDRPFEDAMGECKAS